VTCNDILPALEMGDAEWQQLARRHAADCPACAAAIRRWLALKTALGEAPLLTDQERAVWLAAQGKSFSRNRRPMMIWASAGAAAAAVVLAFLLWPRPVPRSIPGPMPPVESLTFAPERAAREFASFDRQLDQFDNELSAVSNRLALADAKRQAEELGHRYR
jgi:hypothetical protein